VIFIPSAVTSRQKIFSELVEIADRKKRAKEQSGFDGGSAKEIQDFQKTPEGKEIQSIRRELSNYLSSLTFDDIKVIQTVMYLGRDQEHNPEDPPSKIFQDEFNHLDQSGWGPKHAEEGQISQKTPLPDYIRKGFSILGLRL